MGEAGRAVFHSRDGLSASDSGPKSLTSCFAPGASEREKVRSESVVWMGDVIGERFTFKLSGETFDPRDADDAHVPSL